MKIPDWLQIVLWVAAGLTAFYVIYLKGIRPLAKLISETEKAIPVLRSVTEKLSDPDIVDVIVAMAKQFQTDSGSSLRDVVNRLETTSLETKVVTDILRVSFEGGRQLQEGDRAQLSRLLILLERVQTQADLNTGRIMDASDAAKDLAAGVAKDLADSHKLE